jgi:CheY-like chemotaxis protein
MNAISPDMLHGASVLVAEDEALIALEIVEALEQAGATVIGPVASVTDACSAAESCTFDAAVLDVDLRGEDVFPAADILSARQIPFLFHTGSRDAVSRARRYRTAPICDKPVDHVHLIGIVRKLAPAACGRVT